MSSQPWMKFYPSDWRGDQALRAVSIAARGLWIECLCIMHEARPYGHLLLNGEPLEDGTLARMTGISVEDVSTLMSELTKAGVLSVTRKGVVFSRRMVKDDAASKKGRESAKKRWSQATVNNEENDEPNRYPTPTPNTKKPETRYQIPEDITPVPPSGETVPTKVAPRKSPSRGARIPDDWQVGPEERAAAQAAGLPADRVAIEGDKFRDYWRAKTGQGATKADWPATWRNWCRRAAENIGRFPPKPPDKPKFRNGFAEILYDMHAEQQGFFDDQPDRNAEPEIIPPDRGGPRGFRAGGADVLQAGAGPGDQVVVDFSGYRTVA